MPDHAAYEKLLQYKIPEVEQTLSQRDTMLYALGVGLGADPMDEKQLQFVYEKNLAALPTMAVVLAAPHAWLKQTGTGFGAKSVHGEQLFTIHKPIPVEGVLVGVPKLHSVLDKGVEGGKNRGAVIATERKVYDICHDLVAGGMRAGEFRRTPVAPACFAILGINDFILGWYRSKGALSPAQLADNYADLVVRMLRKGEEKKARRRA